MVLGAFVCYLLGRMVSGSSSLATTYRPGTVHDGTEGELYDLVDDPLQQVNRWDDPALAAVRADLVDDLHAHLRAERAPRLPLEAPV